MAAAVDRPRLGPVGYAALTLGALIMVAPILWTLLLSLKDNAELVGHSEAALRPPYTLENYAAIVGNSLTMRWLVNSAIVSVGQTVGVLVLASLAGYGFSRLDFPFRRTLFVIVLLGLAVPSQAVILPQHQLFAWLDLHNSYPGLILPGLVGPFGVFFMTTYMRAIPKELDEAAFVDGASPWKVITNIIFPLARPGLAVTLILTWVFAWNEYLFALILISDESLRAAVDLTDVHQTDRRRPDRAIDALDEACAHTHAIAKYSPRAETLIRRRKELLRELEAGATRQAAQGEPVMVNDPIDSAVSNNAAPMNSAPFQRSRP